MGVVEKWRNAALDALPAYLAHLALLVGAVLWGWIGAGTAGSGGVMMLELP